MQQNMNNALEELQTALKAYEQLAPHANSIQQIQKICNDLNAQAAYMNQLPSLEQAYKLYQQAYPAILELQRIYPKLYAQAVAQSPATPPLPVEELNDVIADMPEPEAWYKSIDKKDALAMIAALQNVLSNLLSMELDEDYRVLTFFISFVLTCISYRLTVKIIDDK